MKKRIFIITLLILFVAIAVYARNPYNPSPSFPGWQNIVKLFNSGSCSGYLNADGTCQSLTSSLPVFSDSSGKLVSKSVADTLTALGLTDSIGTTTLKADHIGERTTSHGVVFDNTATFTNLTVSGAANVTGATWTGLAVGSVTGAAATADLAEDLSTASHYLYKDSGGNITDAPTFPVANGGTGAVTLTQYGVLVGAGTSAVSGLTAGTTGQVLLGSTGANPVFGTLAVGYVTGAAASADLAEDLSTASHYIYKNSAGNITDATVGTGLSDSAGTLSVKQVVNMVFADTDAAVTVATLKKGYVVPSLYNGSTISAMTCAVYDLNSATANATTINLTKASGGVLTNVFDTVANIPFGSYSNTTTGYNATNAVVSTGDFLIANVTAIADPAPKGLSCTFIFAH
jgi:hypothetical protein